MLFRALARLGYCKTRLTVAIQRSSESPISFFCTRPGSPFPTRAFLAPLLRTPYGVPLPLQPVSLPPVHHPSLAPFQNPDPPPRKLSHSSFFYLFSVTCLFSLPLFFLLIHSTFPLPLFLFPLTSPSSASFSQIIQHIFYHGCVDQPFLFFSYTSLLLSNLSPSCRFPPPLGPPVAGTPSEINFRTTIYPPAQGMIRHQIDFLSSTRLQNRSELTKGTIPQSSSPLLLC